MEYNKRMAVPTNKNNARARHAFEKKLHVLKRICFKRLLGTLFMTAH